VGAVRGDQVEAVGGIAAFLAAKNVRPVTAWDVVWVDGGLRSENRAVQRGARHSVDFNLKSH
jgi:hypothetical protein